MTILTGPHSLEFGLSSVLLFLSIILYLGFVRLSLVRQSSREAPTL